MSEQLAVDDQRKIIVKWSGNEYVIDNLNDMATILNLKECIYSKTGVKPERQKLIGLKANNGL